MKTIFAFTVILAGILASFGQDAQNPQYKLLATTKTSTMQKEINQAALLGYRIIVGAPADRSEMVLFLSMEGTLSEPFQYRLLATTRTGTMRKELNEAAADGFRLIPSTMIVKNQMFMGPEIVAILEKVPRADRRFEYKLLATTKTSTLQKEVTEARSEGYLIVGMLNRDEHMVVMEREKPSSD